MSGSCVIVGETRLLLTDRKACEASTHRGIEKVLHPTENPAKSGSRT